MSEASEITDCPHLRRGKGGHVRIQWVREANQRCVDLDHRYLDAMHVPVEVELERLGMNGGRLNA